jgi:hypothetical protein
MPTSTRDSAISTRAGEQGAEYNLEIWQNGEWCAGVSGDDWKRVYAEAMHYALMYGQDGPTEIRGVPPERLGLLPGFRLNPHPPSSR